MDIPDIIYTVATYRRRSDIIYMVTGIRLDRFRRMRKCLITKVTPKPAMH